MENPTTSPACDYCGETENKKRVPLEIHTLAYLETPWSEDENTLELCEECESNAMGESFDVCGVCERTIACTASNGMRSYFSTLYGEEERDEKRMEAYGMDGSGTICVGCLQKHRIKNGLLPCEVEDGESIHADFYNYDELRAAGYEQHATGIFVRRDDDIAGLQRQARELMASGNKVIIDLEASGMGLEGYCGIWIKPVDVLASLPSHA